MQMNLKQMLPMMAAMMIVGISVQLIMGGKFGALLQAMIILGLIAIGILVAYAFEVLPKRMMLLLDRVTGRTDRLKSSRNSKLEVFQRDSTAITAARKRAHDLVYGQAELIDEIYDAIEMNLANKSRTTLLSSLILGPKASGKGRLSAVMALTLFGDHRDAVIIDLSKMAPEAVIGEVFSSSGAVWNALSRDNEIVLVLDHADILLGQLDKQSSHALADLLENGMVAGKVVANNTCILMLSDLGHAELSDPEKAKAPLGERRKQIEGILEQRLPGLNAGLFDLVTATRPLENMDIARVIARHLSDIAADFELEVQQIDPMVLANFVSLWRELSGSGSDEIIRTIKRECNVTFATASRKQMRKVRIGWNADREEIICA